MLERSQSSNDHLGKPVLAVPTRRPLAVWIWSTLLIADAVLIARSVSGEMALSLPPSLALLSMSVVALASFAAWLAFRSDSPHQDISQPSGWLPLAVSLVASVLWCGTLATQASPLAMGLLLGVILFQCLIMLSMVTADQHSGTSSLVTHTVVGSQIPIDAHTLPSLEPFISTNGSLNDSEEFAEHDEDITQWMSRRVTDDGELIEGWLRVEFPAGQREVIAHVSFCPPLSGPPEIETEDLDGANLEIRVGTAFPFGARLTVRRSGSTTLPYSARIGFVVVVAANQKAA